jgi:hypothetical protein
MQSAEQPNLGPTFEQRNHRALRLAQLAPDVGHISLSGAQIEQQDSLESRREDELVSTLAEGLNGKIDTIYSFELVGDKLVAKDGEPIEDMLLRALHEDIKLASRDAFFAFLPIRSKAELDNFRHFQNDMVLKQDGDNTQLEVSVYTEELDTSPDNRKKLIKAAQKPYWGRTMTRVSHWDGKMAHIITLSSDNVKAAETFEPNDAVRGSVALFSEATINQLNYSFKANNSTDILAEPIALNIKDDSWRNLAGDLVAEVDSLLAVQYGGEWDQGRPKSESVDLQKYVESQTEIVKGLRDAEKKVAAHYSDYEEYRTAFETEIYNCLALLEKRLELGKTGDKVVDYVAASAGAGSIARAQGKSYDACGMVINPSSQSQSQVTSTANQTGHESLRRLENKAINCYNCGENVVVPKKYLEKGHLHCVECGYDVEVCTGKTSWGETRRSSSRNTLSGFELISNWFKEQDHELNIGKLTKVYEQAEDEFSKRRALRQIQAEEKALQELQQAA